MPQRDATARRAYNAKYYADHRHVLAPRMLSRARQNRLDATKSMGGKCVRCGSTDQLQFDHIDCKTKVDHRIWTWSPALRQAELDKCQLLCEPCHRKKTIEAGEQSWRSRIGDV